MTAIRAEPHNADYPWDAFDPDAYVAHNYRSLRDDDRDILERVRDHFSERVNGRQLSRGIDVGSGANLYPALAMLPFCDQVVLSERGAANRHWLADQISGRGGYAAFWDPFWAVLTKRQPYDALTDPRAVLRERARIQAGDVLTLPHRAYDLGTMFFVAESMTTREGEFHRAVHRFVRALRPGAPFAAAFMKDSMGYTVGSHRFPAVAVSEVHVDHCLSEVADVDEVVPIRSDTPLREGYGGMTLALGRAGSTDN